jgi:hypothetical protein
MACEVISEREIMSAFVGHHRGFLCDLGLDNRHDIGGARSIDME